MDTLGELIARHKLAQHESAICSLARPCISIHRSGTRQHDLQPTDSRLGGLPHLPAGMEWPRWRGDPLGHIATIRLSEAAKHDPTGLLPSKGLFYFWYAHGNGPWGFDPSEAGFFRVDYTADEDMPLAVASFPDDPISNDVRELMPPSGIFNPCRLSFTAGLTLPDWEWIRNFAPALASVGELNAYSALQESLPTSKSPQHRLLGHAAPQQGPMELECQLVTHGLYCGNASGFNDPRAKTLQPGAANWRLLLQIDTDEKGPGWMWGDVGMLYYWIPESALRERQFDRAWMILQCG